MSRLNCKPGDLARVIRADGPDCRPLLDAIVVVLHAVPTEGEPVMPDGQLQVPIPDHCKDLHWWLCELDAPHRVHLDDGSTRVSLYIPIPDICLKPTHRGSTKVDFVAFKSKGRMPA